MIESVVKRKFDANVFKNMNECAICMEEFNSESEITPLPCDIRHYFHSECISNWFHTNTTCPLCKAAITSEEMKELEKRLQNDPLLKK